MRAWSIVGLLCVLITASTRAFNKGEWWEVDIDQGSVRGRKDSTDDLYVFYNIPYATAPTGEHKFKAPLPPPTWSEPYEAIDKGIICPQSKEYLVMDVNKSTMQEDCLVANIYVPNTEQKQLSVLVYVHGGAFELGYGDWLQAKNLMKFKDLIVVTFNYRLGIHGFICLGTEDVPGNAGMKDQIALLRWVQRNILAFGGNPNDVTIAGSSAGSASVDLLMISKSAEGLFHKVIPESGSNLASFTVQGDPVQNAQYHAKALNFTNIDDISSLEQFYKTLSYDILTANTFFNRPDLIFLFSPCVERNTGDEAFLTDSPISILKRGDYKKVPLLYGFANMEGLLRIDFFDMWKEKMNQKFSQFLPTNLKFESDSERDEVAEIVKEFYFSDKLVDESNILRYVDYFSDIFFVYSTLKAVDLHIKAGHKELYLYEYSFVDDDTPVVPHTNVRGATHCAQSLAVLDGRNEDDITEDYKTMKKTIREIWHNFITISKPVPEGSSLPSWPAVGADRSPYMSLGQKLELCNGLSEDMYQFWDDIYENYYWEPIPPLPLSTDKKL